MLEYIFLLLAIPLGRTLARRTEDEKKIYLKKRYFPTIASIFAITTITSYFFDKTIFFSSFFTTLMLISWSRA